LNPGRRGGKPATKRLSYGAAISKSVAWYNCQGNPLNAQLNPLPKSDLVPLGGFLDLPSEDPMLHTNTTWESNS
jgi:hypothetical protein